MQWLETRLRFKNLKEEITLNNLSPSEMSSIWVPKLIFYNTETKPSTTVDEETIIFAEKQGTSDICEQLNQAQIGPSNLDYSAISAYVLSIMR